MGYPLVQIFRNEVKEFIRSLPRELRQKFAVATLALSEGSFEQVFIKHLKGVIKEAKIQRYRLIFFTHDNSIYFVRIFMKKTNKTPRKEIELVERYYKLITKK